MLNGWLNFAQSHGISDVMYTFGSTAVWASSNPTDTTCKYGPGTCDPPTDVNLDGTGTDQMWIDFVTNLATVGKGRIKYYQLWDTPQDATHWTGSISPVNSHVEGRLQHDQGHRSEREGPVASERRLSRRPDHVHDRQSARRFSLSSAAGAYSDIISFNTYYDKAPEDIIPVISCLETMLTKYGQNTKPLWASEGGWGTSTDLATRPYSPHSWRAAISCSCHKA